MRATAGARLPASARSAYRLVRQTFDWARIETAAGPLSTSRFYDGYMASLAQSGLRVLPILFNPPRLPLERARARRPAQDLPPRRPATWAASEPCWRAATGRAEASGERSPSCRRCRFAPGRSGTSRACPSTGPSGPDAAEYVAAAARPPAQAIKRRRPRRGDSQRGMPESRLGVPFAQYVRGMYEPGATGAFDTLAINPFAGERRRRAQRRRSRARLSRHTATTRRSG